MDFKNMKKLAKEFAKEFDFAGNEINLNCFDLTANDVKFIAKEFIKFLKANDKPLEISLELEPLDFDKIARGFLIKILNDLVTKAKNAFLG